MKQVGVIMGSKSDLPIMQKAIDILKEFGVNSEVKIIDASGIHIRTIFSNGGQAVWDGLDKNHQLVGSGIYYFLATSEDGFSKAKSKILIIR